jgi:hypothetical protein
LADVASTLAAWSSTDASNSPSGATSIGTGLDDNLRALQGVVVRGLSHKGSDIASVAGTMDIGAVEGLMHDITGALAITGLGTVRAGILKVLKFEGAATLTHNATSLILPGAANIVAADGDVGIFISEGSGNWRCLSFVKASGAPIKLSPITASLGADVALNNTANYFDGPSVAQGSAGTWFVSGTVTLNDTAGSADFDVKLWDGTTVISSAETQTGGASQKTAVSLSGFIASPAGNLRISVKDATSTSGNIKFNLSGNSKDSTITAIRIA